MVLDDSQRSGWIGRSETLLDHVGPTPFAALKATLDHPVDSSLSDTPDHRIGAFVRAAPLPPLWHWLYFLPLRRQSEIGADGHARRGSFLPPVPLPRRMWAGSQLEFHSPIRIGDKVARTSAIDDVTTKAGRTGTLVFVRVRHALHCNGATDPALVDFQDIVYCDAKRPGDIEPPPVRAPNGAAWRRTVVPDAVLLFRYSALTFNGHRIHYDRSYATGVEGYPGLVVHGPLIATLLMDLLHREVPDAEVASFNFRAVRPTFDGRPVHFNGTLHDDGKTVHLWAEDHEGWLTMDATATLR